MFSHILENHRIIASSLWNVGTVQNVNRFLGHPVLQIRDCALQTVSNWNLFQKVRQAVLPVGFFQHPINNCWAPYGAAHWIERKSAYWTATMGTRAAGGSHTSLLVTILFVPGSSERIPPHDPRVEIQIGHPVPTTKLLGCLRVTESRMQQWIRHGICNRICRRVTVTSEWGFTYTPPSPHPALSYCAITKHLNPSNQKWRKLQHTCDYSIIGRFVCNSVLICVIVSGLFPDLVLWHSHVSPSVSGPGLGHCFYSRAG